MEERGGKREGRGKREDEKSEGGMIEEEEGR